MSRSRDSGPPTDRAVPYRGSSARNWSRPRSAARRLQAAILPLFLVGGGLTDSLHAAERLQDAGRWNGGDALELLERARTVRASAFVADDLLTYRARAAGFLYFFLRRDGDVGPTLVRADQIALDLYWRAPDHTHQRIVGRRSEKALPTDIRYHLDHLTVVQDEFPDRIRFGGGDEVTDVVHPVAPNSSAVYDYRLVGSINLRLGSGEDTVRVHEVQVRPKEMSAPGVVGSLFLDQATAAIVRMRFTFTPASYVDPYIDYIRVSLENSRWMDRHWLPYRQEFELRREVPYLDVLAGSVIRGRYSIEDYRFNEAPQAWPYRARGVSAAPAPEQASFAFDRPLYSELEGEGLSEPPSIADVRETVRSIVQDRYMSGLGQLRLYAPSASSVYRYNRAEGNTFGAGLTVNAGSRLRLHATGGYSLGRDKPLAHLEITDVEETRWSVSGYVNRPRDIGPIPASSGVVNTLGGLLFDEDWTDPYFASGGSLDVHLPFAPGSDAGTLRLSVGLERHRSATAVVDGAEDFRPVRATADGDLLGFTVEQSWGQGGEPSDGWGAGLTILQAADIGFTDFDHTRVTARAAWSRAEQWHDVDLGARVDAGWTQNDAPVQSRFLLGGRGTLLGHETRSLEGTRFWLLGGGVSKVLRRRLVTGRAFGAVGQAYGSPRSGPMLGSADAGPKASLGLGVALFWEVIRLDWGYGIGSGGSGELAFSVARRFHGWL